MVENIDFEFLFSNIDRLFSNKRKGNTKEDIHKDWDLLLKYYDKSYLFVMLHNAIREEKPAKSKIGIAKDLLNKAMPDIPTIYKLFHKGSLVYIGSTINLNKRVKDHKNSGKIFDEVKIALVAEKDKLKLENYLILKEQPPLNKSIDLGFAKKWKGTEPVFKNPLDITAQLVPSTHLEYETKEYMDKFYLCRGILIPKTVKAYYETEKES